MGPDDRNRKGRKKGSPLSNFFFWPQLPLRCGIIQRFGHLFSPGMNKRSRESKAKGDLSFFCFFGDSFAPFESCTAVVDKKSPCFSPFSVDPGAGDVWTYVRPHRPTLPHFPPPSSQIDEDPLFFKPAAEGSRSFRVKGIFFGENGTKG